MDLIAGKDIITGEKMNRWILAGMIVTPEIVDKCICYYKCVPFIATC
ncbi:MAG: pre-toxin TG domain-containing protein [Cellulosilyticaceae bacterium]